MAKRSNARSKLKARTAGGRTPTQRAPVQRRRDKGTRAKATQLKQNVLNARIESERSRNGRSELARDGGMSRNGQANIAALDHTEASAPMNSAFSTLSRSKYIFGHFYEVSRAQLTLAQMSAQQLQKSLSALITCRSPMEFFQLQNQLVKEQLELLTASLYTQFLKPMSQQSELPQGSL